MSLLVAPVTAEVVRWDMLLANGAQQVINGPNIRLVTNYSRSNKNLALNPVTGALYVAQDKGNTSNNYMLTLDSSVTSTPGSPVDATSGNFFSPNSSPYTGGTVFQGSVAGNTISANYLTSGAIGFNPNYSNDADAHCGSLLQYYGQNGENQWVLEFVPQTASVNWGQIVEGTVANPVNTGARFAYFGLPGHSYSGNIVGIAYLDRATVGSSTQDRWVGYYSNGTAANAGLRIYRTTTDVTGADNTTVGVRTAVNSGLLMTYSQFNDLVPGVTDAVRDIAIRPSPGMASGSFDIYILSYGDSLTFLSAMRANLPAESTGTPGAWSAVADWNWVQLDISGDANDGINHLQLRDTVAAADIAGYGVTFSADGSLMYISSRLQLSTGHTTYDDGRIYIFESPATASTGTIIMVR
jgi:hypothetical protein